MKLVLLVTLTTISMIKGLDRVCYPHLGCFSMKEPWLSVDRPVPAPDPPESMKVRALFYSRSSPDQQIVVSTWPKIDLNRAPFDNRKRTFFIIHGYMTRGTDTWLQNMKLAFLDRYDCNVFIGDWGGGAMNVDYFLAVGNLRMAARQFSNLIHYIIDQHGLNVSTLHILGHSLGAQMSGIIGKSIPGVHRITGMDPAQPLFEGFGPLVKLTKNDAVFVDCIHADARPFIPDMGFGFMNPLCDVDFYYNSGHGQPACGVPKLDEVPPVKSLSDINAIPNELLKQTLLCPHGLSHEFYTEAISNTDCIFWGHNATIKNMLRGVSNAAFNGFFSKYLAISDECTFASCSPVGMDTFRFPARGSFVVNTRGEFPYCIFESVIISEDEQLEFANILFKTVFSLLKP